MFVSHTSWENFSIACVGQGAVSRSFNVRLTKLEPEFEPVHWEVQLTRLAPDENEEPYELTLVEEDDDCARIDVIHNHSNPHFLKAGIPEVLLPAVASRIGRRIRSNSSIAVGNIFRSENATRMWERLRSIGRATLDNETDFYWLS
ncbi:MAG: hypothetical protein WA174_00225 [Rhodoferax sp.]